MVGRRLMTNDVTANSREEGAKAVLELSMWHWRRTTRTSSRRRLTKSEAESRVPLSDPLMPAGVWR